MLDVTLAPSRFCQQVAIAGTGDGYATGDPMKKALMFLAISFALSAPVGGLVLTLIAGTTVVMTVHLGQALAKLQHLQLVRHS